MIGAGARAGAGDRSGVAVVAAWILPVRRGRLTLRVLKVPIVFAVISLDSLFSSSQSRADLTGMSSELTLAGFIDLMSFNVPRLTESWAGPFGTWALGWPDVALPGDV